MENKVTKEDEYDADAFKIAGFAMMAPFGKFVLDIPNLPFPVDIDYVCYVGFTFFLFCLGFVMIEVGSGILEEKNVTRK